ncbi:helix-turn-helix domain-containing protein [Streptosporangium sp. NPDC051022]|uniref:GlxA family transcriptional regulator n=1 Tax=Streptosporangium sp. NPDC051022 TaxID=3155752 RepID=UPI003425071F
MHRIVVLALPGFLLFDLAIPGQIFDSGLRGHAGGPRYDVSLCGLEPGLVMSSTGVPVGVAHGVRALRAADTVIVPGKVSPEEPVAPEILAELRAAHARGARIATICTGAFVLAQAGLLDGRRATTHWANAARLAEVHSEIRVEPEVLYVDDGEILTSAGVAAGIDLCLHMVRTDHGVEIANHIARHTIVPPHRSGGQAQYIERPVPERVGGSLEATRLWLTEQLHRPVSLADMAAHAHLAERTFTRRFRAETGVSPLQWLQQRRLDHARRLLETTDVTVDVVAARSGFPSALALREHFRRVTGTTPGQYRATFLSPSSPTPHHLPELSPPVS